MAANSQITRRAFEQRLRRLAHDVELLRAEIPYMIGTSEPLAGHWKYIDGLLETIPGSVVVPCVDAFRKTAGEATA